MYILRFALLPISGHNGSIESVIFFLSLFFPAVLLLAVLQAHCAAYIILILLIRANITRYETA